MTLVVRPWPHSQQALFTAMCRIRSHTSFISSATLVVLLKKDAETMAAMKQAQGPTYLQPQRPLGMGSTFLKLTSNCALHLIRGAMGPAVGPAQFSVETKGGCDLVQ